MAAQDDGAVVLEELSDFSEMSFGSPGEDDAFSLRPIGAAKSPPAPKCANAASLSQDEIDTVLVRRGVNGLVDLLQQRKDEPQSVLKVLEALAAGDANVVALNPRRLMEALVPAVDVAHADMARLVCSMLGTLAFCDTNKSGIASRGGARLVVDFMASAGDGLQCLCVETLCTLAQHAPSRAKVVEGGAIEAVTSAMADAGASSELKACSCRLLHVLCEDAPTCHRALQAEALEALVANVADLPIDAAEACGSGMQLIDSLLDASGGPVLLRVAPQLVKLCLHVVPDSMRPVEARSAALVVLDRVAAAKCELPVAETASMAANLVEEVLGEPDVVVRTLQLLHRVVVESDDSRAALFAEGPQVAQAVLNAVVLAMGTLITVPKEARDAVQNQGKQIMQAISSDLENAMRSPAAASAPLARGEAFAQVAVAATSETERKGGDEDRATDDDDTHTVADADTDDNGEDDEDFDDEDAPSNLRDQEPSTKSGAVEQHENQHKNQHEDSRDEFDGDDDPEELEYTTDSDHDGPEDLSLDGLLLPDGEDEEERKNTEEEDDARDGKDAAASHQRKANSPPQAAAVQAASEAAAANEELAREKTVIEGLRADLSAVAELEQELAAARARLRDEAEAREAREAEAAEAQEALEAEKDKSRLLRDTLEAERSGVGLLEQTLAAEREAKAALASELDHATARLEAQNSSETDTDARVAELEQSLAEARGASAGLDRKLDELHAEAESLRSKEAEAAARADRLERELEDFRDSAKQDQRAASAAWDAERSKLESKAKRAAELEEELNKAKAEGQDLKAQAQQSLEAAQAAWEAERAQLQEKVAGLAADLADAQGSQETAQELEGQLQELREEAQGAQDLQAMLSKERNERAKLEGELASLRFDKAHSDTTFTELETAISRSKDLESELQNAAHNLKQAQEQNASLRAEVESLKERLQGADIKARNTERRLATLRQEQRHRNELLEQAQAHINDLNRKLSATEWQESPSDAGGDERAALSARLTALEASFAAERDQLSAEYSQKVQAIRTQLESEYRMIVSATSSSRARLEQRLEESDNECARLSRELRQLRDQSPQPRARTASRSCERRGRARERACSLPDEMLATGRAERDGEEGWRVSRVIEQLPFGSKLKALFDSLEPCSGTAACANLYRLVRATELVPAHHTRAKFDMILAEVADKTKRKGRVDMDGFGYALCLLARRLEQRGRIQAAPESGPWALLGSLLDSPPVAAFLAEQSSPEQQPAARPATGGSVSAAGESDLDDSVTDVARPLTPRTPMARRRRTPERTPTKSPARGPLPAATSRLWSREKKALRDIFAHYSTSERDQAAQQTSSLDQRTVMHVVHHGAKFHSLAHMCADFEITPTLATRSELRRLFNQAIAAEPERGSLLLSMDGCLRVLESIAVAKFPRQGWPNADMQVAAMLRWMDASQGKMRLYDRQRSGVLVGKFNVSVPQPCESGSRRPS